ncbi:single-stranded DNA-binding protein [Pseudarthrobacter sp. J47]|uniref:single-stranded DNA-binding protein n=1 Tax=Pseudarthrobacter sp. J47 TaxID=3116482 RepID=UPI002E812460|nr:single-stranded DNA-binding protein [Pseudarthrobacter sp. J47]MEE2524497.1 single-stranded DNA-binding protein [Pseudarthrobacter sp. J47]
MDAQHFRGNIGNDVVLETTKDSNIPFLKLRIAVNDSYQDRDGQWKERETFWLNTELWRGLATRAADALSNGDPVVVIGKFRSSSYEVDGKKRTRNYFVAESISPDLAHAEVSGVKRIMKQTQTPAAGQQQLNVTQTSEGGSFKEPETENPFQ